MTEDPVRLLSQEDDAFTTSLLRSAKEGDRDDARAHKALVLGAAGGAAAGTAALATAARLSSKGFFASAAGKWVLAGLLVVGGAGSAVLFWPRDAQNPAAASTIGAVPAIPSESAAARSTEITPAPRGSAAPEANEPASSAAANEPAPAHAAANEPAPAQPTSGDSKAASNEPSRTGPRGVTPEKAGQASASSARSNPASPPTSSPPTAPGLAEEVAAIQAARDALAKGQAARCLDAVNAYFAAFPAGRLSAEARYLRVEALFASGRRDEAKALAHSMLQQNAKSPYASRLRTIAGEESAP